MYVYLSKKKHRKNKPETNKIGYIKDKDGIAVEGVQALVCIQYFAVKTMLQ